MGVKEGPEARGRDGGRPGIVRDDTQGWMSVEICPLQGHQGDSVAPPPPAPSRATKVIP